MQSDHVFLLRIYFGWRPDLVLYEAHEDRATHSDQNDDQDGWSEANAQPLVETINTQVVAVIEITPDREEVAEEQASNQETDDENHCIDLAGCNRCSRRSWTIATDDHAEAEDQSTDRHRQQESGQHVDLRNIQESNQAQAPIGRACRLRSPRT